MAHERAFRFGLQLATATSAKDWAEQAKRAEDLGFSSLLMPDHFGDQLAPIAGLMAAADATTSLRIGALVHDNDYRHPVVLAKESATLDLLSDGRLELGVGAGWMNTDYEQSGIPKDPAGVRIERLEEALDILDGLFADGPFDYQGQHYTITGLDGLPKPLQKPRPPLIIGGGGKRVLSLAARRADIVGIANFVTFLERTESYRRDLRRAEYGDERDPKMREFLTRVSPVNNAHRITRPLFVAHGRNDPRVPYTEAEQIVETVRKNGTPVWYLLAANEGHGFAKKENADFYFYATIRFLEETVLKQ